MLLLNVIFVVSIDLSSIKFILTLTGFDPPKLIDGPIPFSFLMCKLKISATHFGQFGDYSPHNWVCCPQAKPALIFNPKAY